MKRIRNLNTIGSLFLALTLLLGVSVSVAHADTTPPQVDNSLPTPPPHVDNSLPTPPVHVDNSLPTTPTPPHVDNSLPTTPPQVDNSLPTPTPPPPHIDNSLPSTPPPQIDNSLPAPTPPQVDNSLPLPPASGGPVAPSTPSTGTGNGGGTTPPSTVGAVMSGTLTSGKATLSPATATVPAGGHSIIDFNGRNFGHEETIVIKLNGNQIRAAHADGGGNFSTGSMVMPSAPGVYTFTFIGQNSGIWFNSVVTVQ